MLVNNKQYHNKIIINFKQMKMILRIQLLLPNIAVMVQQIVY